jgi:hypothetical protein
MKKLSKMVIALGMCIAALALEGCHINARVVIGHDRGGHGRWCGRDRWGRPYCDSFMRAGEKVSDNSIKFVTHDSRVATVSDRYNISHYAATHVVRAIVLADKGDMSGLQHMGLTSQDAQDVYSGKALPEVKLNAVGTKLNMSNEDTEILMAKIAKVVQEAN